jgi:hypothetical protein
VEESMTEPIRFEVTFHSPFRVSTGHARAGLDAAVDMDNPLPKTSLKGVMRATAKQLLSEHAGIIDEVFGSARNECPWRWSDAKPDESGWDSAKAAARLRIAPETHTAMPDMLGISEQTGAARASFTITQRGKLSPEKLAEHRAVLAIAGRATRSLGADRRRGLGWVTITCTDVELDRETLARFLSWGEA